MVMKKLALLSFLLLFGASIVVAQKTDSAKNINRNVNGITMSSSKDIVENLSLSPEFTTLVKLIQTAGLEDNFKSGTLTFFAPTNKAFDQLAPGTLDTLLLPAHKADLVNLLNYHVVSGKITSKDIARLIKAGNGQATITTLSGGTLTAHINENRSIVLTDENGGQSIVLRFDIEQNNGILHIVNTVLNPKHKQ
jgi:uncharacterized surface protein with fasciclin (FAS1) repeats